MVRWCSVVYCGAVVLGGARWCTVVRWCSVVRWCGGRRYGDGWNGNYITVKITTGSNYEYETFGQYFYSYEEKSRR